MGAGDWLRGVFTVPGTNAAKDAAIVGKEAAQRGAKYGEEIKELSEESRRRTAGKFKEATGALDYQRGEVRDLRDSMEAYTPDKVDAYKQRAVDREKTYMVQNISAGEAPQASKTQMGPAAQMDAAQIGQIDKTKAAQLGPAAQMEAAQIQGGQDARQQQLLDALTRRAMGEGPSAAQMAAQRGRDENIQQQMAMAASARGNVNAGMAQRQAAQGVAAGNQAITRDAMIAQAQEQQQAQSLAAQSLQGARGQDIELGTAQAGLTQDANKTNVDALNTYGLKQGEFDQEAGVTDAKLAAEAKMKQADLYQDSSKFNAGETNTMTQAQGTLDQGVELANMDSRGKFALADADLSYKTQTANQAAVNDMSQFYGGLDQERYENNLNVLQDTQKFNRTMDQAFQFDKTNALKDLLGTETQTSLTQYDMLRGRDMDQMNAMVNAGNLSIGAAGALANTAQAAMAPGQATVNMVGSLAKAGGMAAAAASDKKVKTDMESPHDKNAQLIEALKDSKEYSYKPGYDQDTSKRYFGPMANDLDDSMVIRRDGIKMIDTGRFALSLGSVVGEQQKEIDRLKKALAGGSKNGSKR